MQKLICLTSRTLIENGIEKQFVNTRYLTPLIERGLNTVMLTLENPNPEMIFDLCDGFVVTGGVDLNPETYHKINEGLSKDVCDRLDRLDQQVISYAKSHHKPLLGICRGHQSLNVFMGGSLIQDLGSIGKSHEHISDHHTIHAMPNSFVELDKHLKTNSFHHQAIDQLAPDFKIFATHEDGTIEAIIHKELPMIGVQWHPEASPTSEVSKRIFDAFLKLIK